MSHSGPPTRAPHAVSRRRFLVASLGVGAIPIAAALPGCGAIHFDVTQAIPEQRVQGNVLAGLLGTFFPAPFALSINLEQETKARGTGPAHSASLKSLTFRVTNISSPPKSTDNFDFVDSIEIFIESTKSGTTLTKKKVADLQPVPKSSTMLTLRCYSEVDLVPYINEGSRISSTASGRVPQNDVTFDGQLVVEVRV